MTHQNVNLADRGFLKKFEEPTDKQRATTPAAAARGSAGLAAPANESPPIRAAA